MWLKPLINQNPNFLLSYELHVYMACPLNLQPAVKACSPGPTEVKYTGKGQSANVSNLEPYTTYNLRVVSYNSVGSSASEWIGFTTEKEREYKKQVAHQQCPLLRHKAAQCQMVSPLQKRTSPETSLQCPQLLCLCCLFIEILLWGLTAHSFKNISLLTLWYHILCPGNLESFYFTENGQQSCMP